MCKQFCKATGKPFNSSVFIVSATANFAAAQIDGSLIHSVAGLRKKENFLGSQIDWMVAKILFIVETSMFNIDDLSTWQVLTPFNGLV
jgi:hypothetical protein